MGEIPMVVPPFGWVITTVEFGGIGMVLGDTTGILLVPGGSISGGGGKVGVVGVVGAGGIGGAGAGGNNHFHNHPAGLSEDVGS